MLLSGSEMRIAMGKARGMIQRPWHGMAWSSSPQASIFIYLQSNHDIIRSRRELLLEHPHLCVMQSLLLGASGSYPCRSRWGGSQRNAEDIHLHQPFKGGDTLLCYHVAIATSWRLPVTFCVTGPRPGGRAVDKRSLPGKGRGGGASSATALEASAASRCYPVRRARSIRRAEDDAWIVVGVHNAGTLKADIVVFDATRYEICSGRARYNLAAADSGGFLALSGCCECGCPHSSAGVFSLSLLRTESTYPVRACSPPPHPPAVTSHRVPSRPSTDLPHCLPASLHGCFSKEYLGPDPEDASVPRWKEPNLVSSYDDHMAI
jgi:hypothetical protein